MRASTRLLGLGLLLSACEPPPLVARGGPCHSLSDCHPGLTCVEGRCSDDVSSLRGEVPTYEMADAGAMDAAVDAEAGVMMDAQVMDTGAPGPDAGSAPDAAGPRDAGGGMPDTAMPQPEAGAPDTAVPDAASDASEPDVAVEAGGADAAEDGS